MLEFSNIVNNIPNLETVISGGKRFFSDMCGFYPEIDQHQQIMRGVVIPEQYYFLANLYAPGLIMETTDRLSAAQWYLSAGLKGSVQAMLRLADVLEEQDPVFQPAVERLRRFRLTPFKKRSAIKANPL